MATRVFPGQLPPVPPGCRGDARARSAVGRFARVSDWRVRAEGDLPGTRGLDVQVIVAGLEVVNEARTARTSRWNVDESRQIGHVAKRRLGIDGVNREQLDGVGAW